MHILPIAVFLLAVYQLEAQSSSEIRDAKSRVRRYFRLLGRQEVSNNMNWVSNSGKIGSGFDSFVGSPTCYTGQCQMEGFRRPLFKLNMTKQAAGSCTGQMIPQHVDLDCLSPMQMTNSTESITTLNQLQESTKKGLEISASVGVYLNSLSYAYSSEIRSMVDTIVEKNSTVYFTRAITVRQAPNLNNVFGCLQLSAATRW